VTDTIEHLTRLGRIISRAAARFWDWATQDITRLPALLLIAGIAIAGPVSHADAFSGQEGTLGLSAPVTRERASRGYTSRMENKRKIIVFYHNPRQRACALSVYWHESGWNMKADNPTSSAYGIPQILLSYAPSAKWVRHYKHSADFQIRAGDRYIENRYGAPCGAWAFWQAHRWY